MDSDEGAHHAVREHLAVGGARVRVAELVHEEICAERERDAQ
jgi:hypothetical protein